MLAGDDVFTIDAESATLTPGESLDVEVAFTATDEAEYTATITITSNDPDAPEAVVTFTGTGVTELAGVRTEVDADGNELVGFLNDDDEVNLFDFFFLPT